MNLDKDKLLSAFPDMPQSFENKIDYSLNNINRQKTYIIKRKFVTVLVTIILIVASIIGVSEGIRMGLFDFLFKYDEVPQNAIELLQTDLAYLKINDIELRASECLFDGATIKLVVNITTKLNEDIKDYDIGNFNSKFNQELNKNNVTLQYGLDWFNLDKKHYAMTNNSSQVIVPDTTQKGAAIAYFEIYTIDNTINIPDDNFNLDIPVAIDGKGKAKQMTIPIKLINNGQIKKYHGEDKYLDYGKIYNIDAKISPLKIYLSLKMDFYECADNDDCQNIINYWREFALVDKYGNIYGYSGNVVSSGYFVDDNGTTHITKEIQYYPAENYPNELYIAPVGYFGNENELTSNIDMAIKLIGG